MIRPGAGPRRIMLQASPHAEGVCIAVRDNGVGMAPEMRDRLFEPFSTTRPDGMGMGLAVCKACVETHGGRLWVEDTSSEPGTAVLFTLPKADQG
jgi:signal transduction histidine kinase